MCRFHVDDHSSAHVYLRLKPGETIDSLPEAVLEDCCQLVKANSIEGCKLNEVTVVYTPWTNLKKTGSMEVGQVAFHDNKLVKKRKVTKKNEILKRLNKAKREENPNLAALREERDRREREQKKKEQQEQKRREKEQQLEQQRLKELHSYDRLTEVTGLKSNKEMAAKSVQEYEDDFM